MWGLVDLGADQDGVVTAEGDHAGHAGLGVDLHAVDHDVTRAEPLEPPGVVHGQVDHRRVGSHEEVEVLGHTHLADRVLGQAEHGAEDRHANQVGPRALLQDPPDGGVALHAREDLDVTRHVAHQVHRSLVDPLVAEARVTRHQSTAAHILHDLGRLLRPVHLRAGDHPEADVREVGLGRGADLAQTQAGQPVAVLVAVAHAIEAHVEDRHSDILSIGLWGAFCFCRSKRHFEGLV